VREDLLVALPQQVPHEAVAFLLVNKTGLTVEAQAGEDLFGGDGHKGAGSFLRQVSATLGVSENRPQGLTLDSPLYLLKELLYGLAARGAGFTPAVRSATPKTPAAHAPGTGLDDPMSAAVDTLAGVSFFLHAAFVGNDHRAMRLTGAVLVHAYSMKMTEPSNVMDAPPDTR
jgi:hypothetical protein